MNYSAIIRDFHLLSASIWLGAVLIMNIVLVPATKKSLTQLEVVTLHPIIKKVVLVVSISALVTSITGGIILWIQTRFDFVSMLENTRGKMILIAGGIGFVITVFHFLGESSLEKYLRKRFPTSDEFVVGYKGIEFIPRIGLVIISAIFITMLVAVRGI